MGAAEAVLAEDGVGLGGEVAIGEEQQLDALAAPPPRAEKRRRCAADFMSVMLTYFATFGTAEASLRYKVPARFRCARTLGARKTPMSVLPFDDRDGFIWYDGRLVPWRDAKLHVLTHGLHYASCVFEGERVYNGKVFHLDDHNAAADQFGARSSASRSRTSMDDLARATQELSPPTRSSTAMSGRSPGAAPSRWASRPQLEQDSSRDRHLGLAGLFLARGARQGHPHDAVEMGASGAEYRAGPCQGVGPLHDLHAWRSTRPRRRAMTTR